MDSSNQALPTDFPVGMNQPLPDDQARTLRTALARETALQDHLEQQHIEMENEASKAQDIVSSLVTCHAASERVHQLLDVLRTAVTESKDLMSSTINVHDTEAGAANKLATTTAARAAWGDLVQLLEALTPQINATIASTQSHTLSAYNEVCTHKFLAECTRNSIAALDVSLDAIATSLSFKRGALSSIFRIPNEVFGMVFQFAVEEERERLRANFSSSSISFNSPTDMIKTIPSCPFTLAAVCRRWRNIALHTPKLWSYIRVYTSIDVAPVKGKKSSTCLWIGKGAFETSLQRAKGAPLELAIYQDPFKHTKSSPYIPPDAKISVIYLVRLVIAPKWLPSCSRLSLFGRADTHRNLIEVSLNPVESPVFPVCPKEILCDNTRPIFSTRLASTTSFYFYSEKCPQIPNLDQLSEKLPNLEYLQLLLPEISALSSRPTITAPRTWKSLKTLRITSSVLPSFGALAEQGLSLPSLTTLILTNVFAAFLPGEFENIKGVVQTLTSLEIHDISPLVKGSELRALIDWMECLQTVTLHRASLQKTVKALSITPSKRINRLVIDGTVLKGLAEVRRYAAHLEGSDNTSGGSESMEFVLEITQSTRTT